VISAGGILQVGSLLLTWLSFFLFASDSFRTGEKNEFKILAHLQTEKNLESIFLFWADSLLLLCLISNLSLLVLFLLLPYG
jgi:hypothetical protein